MPVIKGILYVLQPHFIIISIWLCSKCAVDVKAHKRDIRFQLKSYLSTLSL